LTKLVGNNYTLIARITHIIKKPSTPWLFFATVIAVLLLTCLFPLIYNSLQADDAWLHLSTYLLPSYALNTLILVLGVSLGSLLLGVGTAYCITRFDFFGRTIIEKLLVLPLAIPSYLLAYALSGFFDYTGPFKQFVTVLFGTNIGENAYLDVQHIIGLIVVISVALYPYVYLAAKASFKQLSRQYVEVGYSLQLTANQTWRKIILPLAFPAIAGSLLLVVMECLNDYGASKYFGVNTLTTGVFRAWFSMNSLASASKIAAMLLGFILLLIWLKNLVQAKKKYVASKQATTTHKTKISFVKQGLVIAFCSLPIIIGLIIPIIYMVYAWVQSSFDTGYVPYISLITNSFMLAFIVAFAAILISLLWQFTAHYYRASSLLKLVRIATVGYTIPGAVIGIGVIGVAFSINYLTGWYVSGSFGLLVFGLIFRLIAVGYQNIQAGFVQLPSSTVDLGVTLGISGKKMLRNIYLPLNKNYLAIGFLLVFIDVLKELPLTLILRPFNFDTLATKTYEYANDELLFASFHVAPFIIIMSIIPIWLLQKINKHE
jgi:iron(III) transport system permease protein